MFLISLDTVAAEYCSVYGYEKQTTPFLEELGAKGAVFERHVTISNNTLKSHASIMTGLLPAAHGVDDLGKKGRFKLESAYPTLAEQFQAAGYATAAFTTHAIWLNKEFGFDQGFDHFESRMRGAPRNSHAFLEWFDEEDPDHAFVFLHYFDAHSDGSMPDSEAYEASPDALAKFARERPDDYEIRFKDKAGEQYFGSEALRLLSPAENVIPAEHLAYLRGTYDAGLFDLDNNLRALFQELEKRGILDDSLIVITSDHGEEFKQHDRLLHHQYFSEVMRVPLIITLPKGQRPAKARVEEVTRSIDLASSMLELAGLEPLPITQGQSFARTLLLGESLPYGDTMFEKAILRSRDEHGEYKIGFIRGGFQFYDLDADPGEMHNLGGSVDRARIKAARERIDSISKESRDIRRAIGAKRSKGPELTEDDLEELQSLGYLGDDE